MDYQAWLIAATMAASAGPAGHAHPPVSSLPRAHSVPGFQLPTDGISFYNYSIWAGSSLPAAMQVAHCSGMALLVRQVFNFATFDPSQPRLPAPAYEPVLRRIYDLPTTTRIGSRTRIVIPGYSSLHELTASPGLRPVVENVLRDALRDALRPNWGWSPLDVFGYDPARANRIEARLRAGVVADKVQLLYLTDGTAMAHAILLYGYDVRTDGSVVYLAYDSNRPYGPLGIVYDPRTGKFDHPDWGLRDPFILHAY